MDIKEKTEEVLIHAYGKRPLTLVKGSGVTLTDDTGKEYLDGAAGIAVCALGYGNKKYSQALSSQINEAGLLQVSNLFYNEWGYKAGEKIVKATGLDKVFFTNSGAEAVEGALKLARKYYYNKTGKAGGKIIAMDHSFHGRTFGALSVTGKAAYREPFEPLVGGVSFATFNDLDSVKALVTDETCCIIMETVQGEGGIYPAKPEFLQGVRKLCDEKGILLILDEIQCGMGRTGKMMAYEHYGIKPDIVTMAKALGCGVPVGAFAAKAEVADALMPGDHGTTYGGNPFVCKAVSTVFDCFEELDLVDHAAKMGECLKEAITKKLAGKEEVKDIRGLGLMFGIEFSCPVAPVIEKAREKGLIIISAGNNIIRLVPPLVIEKEDIEKLTDILSECI